MILITRPIEDSLYLKEKLYALGIDSFIYPLLIPEFYKIDHAKLKDHQTLVTSKNAVRALIENDIKDINLITMTENIANFARSSGFTSVQTSGSKNVLEFKQRIAKSLEKNKKIIYLSGLDITYDIVKDLKKNEFSAESVVVYKMAEVRELSCELIKMINSGEIDGIAIFSARTANIFCKLATRYKINVENVMYFALSKKIASILHFDKVLISKFPDVESIIDLILLFYNRNYKAL